MSFPVEKQKTKTKTKTKKQVNKKKTLHAFFISNTRLKFKNQAKAKQHFETELWLFENESVSSSMLASKTNLRYSKNCAKSKCLL